MSKPSPTDYPGYFKRYIDMVPETDLAIGFKNQLGIIVPFLDAITEEKSAYAYAEGKWTLKELLLHIIDTERVFSYRAMCFARNDKTSFPGFDENDYAANSNANSRSWESLVKEFFIVRKATEILFDNFSPEVLKITGTANNNPTSVESVGFMALGHFYHHKKIIEERYL